jgi:hypothetical protein
MPNEYRIGLIIILHSTFLIQHSVGPVGNRTTTLFQTQRCCGFDSHLGHCFRLVMRLGSQPVCRTGERGSIPLRGARKCRQPGEVCLTRLAAFPSFPRLEGFRF